MIRDPSPVANLARIEALSLPPNLYVTVLLPETVWTEVVVERDGTPGARTVRKAPWIKRQPVSNRNLVRALRQDLDAGEAEAIALAIEANAALLLMDERQGRETAEHFDLSYIDLIGVFVEARGSGHIEAVRSYLGD